MFLNAGNAAANSYMYTKYTNIKGAKHCLDSQTHPTNPLPIDVACGNSTATDPAHKD
jgi:hypothetical protein